jgi:hypothetical protein
MFFFIKESPKSSIHFVLQRLFYSVNVLLPRLYKNYSVDPITFRYSLSNVFAVTNLTEEIQLETAIDTTELIISCLLTLVDFEANQKGIYFSVFDNYILLIFLYLEVNDLEVRRGLDSLTNGFEYVLKSVVPRLIKDFSIENI